MATAMASLCSVSLPLHVTLTVVLIWVGGGGLHDGELAFQGPLILLHIHGRVGHLGRGARQGESPRSLRPRYSARPYRCPHPESEADSMGPLRRHCCKHGWVLYGDTATSTAGASTETPLHCMARTSTETPPQAWLGHLRRQRYQRGPGPRRRHHRQFGRNL